MGWNLFFNRKALKAGVFLGQVGAFPSSFLEPRWRGHERHTLSVCFSLYVSRAFASASRICGKLLHSLTVRIFPIPLLNIVNITVVNKFHNRLIDLYCT